MRKWIAGRTKLESCEKVRTELQPAGTVLPPGCAKMRHTHLPFVFAICHLYFYLCLYLYLVAGCSTSLVVQNWLTPHHFPILYLVNGIVLQLYLHLFLYFYWNVHLYFFWTIYQYFCLNLHFYWNMHLYLWEQAAGLFYLPVALKWDTLCFSFVFVVYMHLYLWFICICICGSRKAVLPPGRAELTHIKLSPRPTATNQTVYLYLSLAFIICICRLYLSFVTCICHLYLSRVFVICHLYLYLWHQPGQVAPQTK